MKLYLVDAENIYFSQIRNYFKEIISSYDNENYRSAMVMLYSTIICDLLLKLKELSDVYNDSTAESLLNEINKERIRAGDSSWEHKLVEKIYKSTELLSAESYTIIKHIHDLRNFSAHPAMNEDYDLISPNKEIVAGYIKESLENIFVKPSVFAQNIVDRMSDDVAERKEQYQNDFIAFEQYLNKVYFQRMSDRMIEKVFRSFWKFTLKKSEDIVYQENRNINRKVMEVMLRKYYDNLCESIKNDSAYFTISSDTQCLGNATILCSCFPKIYENLDVIVKHQLRDYKEKDAEILQWFTSGDLRGHLLSLRIENDKINFNVLYMLDKICRNQGQPSLFTKFLINHYSQSNTYSSARNRFDHIIEPYLNRFSQEDFVLLLEAINKNNQIYNYSLQQIRNDRILEVARTVLPDNFDFSKFKNFKFSGDDVEGSRNNEANNDFNVSNIELD